MYFCFWACDDCFVHGSEFADPFDVGHAVRAGFRTGFAGGDSQFYTEQTLPVGVAGAQTCYAAFRCDHARSQ